MDAKQRLTLLLANWAPIEHDYFQRGDYGVWLDESRSVATIIFGDMDDHRVPFEQACDWVAGINLRHVAQIKPTECPAPAAPSFGAVNLAHHECIKCSSRPERRLADLCLRCLGARCEAGAFWAGPLPKDLLVALALVEIRKVAEDERLAELGRSASEGV